MSGGHFNHIDSQIRNFVSDLEYEITNNTHYNNDTIIRFKEVLIQADKLAELIHQIDYLCSGDIGEETFNILFDKIKRDEYKGWRDFFPG